MDVNVNTLTKNVMVASGEMLLQNAVVGRNVTRILAVYIGRKPIMRRSEMAKFTMNRSLTVLFFLLRITNSTSTFPMEPRRNVNT